MDFLRSHQGKVKSMGLLKGAFTFSRYRIQGDLPEPSGPFLKGQMKTYAFREMTSGAEEKSKGWASIENVLDTDFAQASYAFGNYFAFLLRMDRKAIPPSLLKIKFLEAERKWRKENPGRRGKQQADEIKERIRLELLTRAHPSPSFFDICWAVAGKWLLFGSLTSKAGEEFEDLFKRTFQVSLSPFLPWDPSVLEASLAKKISALQKGVLLSPEAKTEEQKDPGFLGREFLTWLWFKSEERDGAIKVPNLGDLQVVFSRRVVLESGDGEYSESVVCQGLHADLKEGKTAIHHGKKIKEARMQLTRDSEKWEFTLKADAFQFQSMRLPEGMASDDPNDFEGQLLERIYLAEKAIQTMDEVFSFFLAKRASPQWASEEIPKMKKWAQS
jgi:hypothetical protein